MSVLKDHGFPYTEERTEEMKEAASRGWKKRCKSCCHYVNNEKYRRSRSGTPVRTHICPTPNGVNHSLKDCPTHHFANHARELREWKKKMKKATLERKMDNARNKGPLQLYEKVKKKMAEKDARVEQLRRVLPRLPPMMNHREQVDLPSSRNTHEDVGTVDANTSTVRTRFLSFKCH